jgi:hypothetical protein
MHVSIDRHPTMIIQEDNLFFLHSKLKPFDSKVLGAPGFKEEHEHRE